MTRALIAPFVVALIATACGSGPSSGNANTNNSPSSIAVLEVAGPTPSASARMVCEDEARGEIAAAIGRDASKVTKPTWRRSEHVLSCDYDYGAKTKMTLTVKELSSVGETSAYFESLATRLGRGRTFEIGQGAFDTTSGSVVVRKDYKVLLIDVSGLPPQFGNPPTSRESVAVNTATVIMACWSGA